VALIAALVTTTATIVTAIEAIVATIEAIGATIEAIASTIAENFEFREALVTPIDSPASRTDALDAPRARRAACRALPWGDAVPLRAPSRAP
jgi:hypothetical protein